MDYPFLNPLFLDALEASGSVGPGTGWLPWHLRLEANGQQLATMPLYRKSDSRGEYVFDWSWAAAYRRAGLPYYPKLVTAVPFTPTTGTRVIFAPGADRRQVCAQLLDLVIERARDSGASSWHLLFPEESLSECFDDPRLLDRHGVQFHWHNRAYSQFEHFLGDISARRRKMIRRERRRVADQGIQVTMLAGEEISDQLWDLFYRLYQDTYLKRSGNSGYLRRDFFRRIARDLSQQVRMAVASSADGPVATALFFQDAETLYGRYWGCLREVDCLHFELCYYQGIEYAIAQGLRRFDAGAQGEHKLLRGFEPVLTHSLHWLDHPEFRDAVADFLMIERRQITAYIEQARLVLPFRAGHGPDR